MARVIEITKYGKQGKGKRKFMFFPKFQPGVTTTGIATIIIIGALCFIYLMQANQTATFGYEIEKLDKKLEALKKENQVLELEGAKLRSTNKVKERLENNEINMIDVDPKEITYYEYELKEDNKQIALN
jgi:cell division protein FtsB